MSLTHVASSGSVAEEVISTIRTAQAFGTQKVLASLYDAHLAKANVAEVKTAMWLGGGMGTFFFFMYSSYALGKHFSQTRWRDGLIDLVAFSFGTTLILRGHGSFFHLLLFLRILILSQPILAT